MQRKNPSHMIKYYEALWAVADSRVVLWTIADGVISAKVSSSDQTKIYTIRYSQDHNAIMSNDNSSYWNDELGYPSMALLLFLDRLDYQDRFGEMLADFPWKVMNVRNKNDRDLTQDEVDATLHDRGQDVEALHSYCQGLIKRVEELQLQYLWFKQKPFK